MAAAAADDDQDDDATTKRWRVLLWRLLPVVLRRGEEIRKLFLMMEENASEPVVGVMGPTSSCACIIVHAFVRFPVCGRFGLNW